MSKAWMRIISVLEMIGGAVGVGLVIWWLLATPVNAFTVAIAPIPISIYIFSFVAGVSLWRGSSFGRKASIVVQVIQLPKVVSPFIIFMFSFGLDLWVHTLFAEGFSTVGFEFRALAFHQFFINVQAPVGIGVSLTAVISLVMLIRYKPEGTQEVAMLPPAPVPYEVE